MAKKPVSRVIGSNVYEFFYLPPRVAMRVLTRITKLVGEPIGLLAGVAGQGDAKKALKSVMDANLPPEALGNAARALVARLDEGEVVETIDTMMEHVHTKRMGDNGTRVVNLDNDFKGELKEMLVVLMTAMEVNFGDFFGASGDVVAAAANPTV